MYSRRTERGMRPSEVGREDRGSLEDGDQDDRALGEVARDPLADRLDAVSDLGRREPLVVEKVHGTSLAGGVSRTVKRSAAIRPPAKASRNERLPGSEPARGRGRPARGPGGRPSPPAARTRSRPADSRSRPASSARGHGPSSGAAARLEGGVDPFVDRGQAARQRLGGAGEPEGRPGPSRLQAWEDAVADPVPGEPLVGVRGVLAPRDSLGAEEVPELCAPEREEWPDDAVGPPRADAAAGAAEPSLEVEEDRLGLVLQRVAGGEERPGAEVAPEGEERRRTGGAAPPTRGSPRARRRSRTGKLRKTNGSPSAAARSAAARASRCPSTPRSWWSTWNPTSGRPRRRASGARRTRSAVESPPPEQAATRHVAPSRRPVAARWPGEGVAQGASGGGERGRNGRRHPRMVGETGRAGRIGGDGRTRTADTGLMRPPLYRLSYIATSRPQSGEWYQNRGLLFGS